MSLALLVTNKEEEKNVFLKLQKIYFFLLSSTYSKDMIHNLFIFLVCLKSRMASWNVADLQMPLCISMYVYVVLVKCFLFFFNFFFFCLYIEVLLIFFVLNFLQSRQKCFPFKYIFVSCGCLMGLFVVSDW